MIRTISNFLGQSGEATRQLAAFQEAVAVVTKCHPRSFQPFMMVGLGDNRTGKGVESKKHWVSMHVYHSSTAQGGGGSFKDRKLITGEGSCCDAWMAE